MHAASVETANRKTTRLIPTPKDLSEQVESSQLARMSYSLNQIRLVQVTVLPTAFTTLTRTSCLETRAGSVGNMFLPLLGGTLKF